MDPVTLIDSGPSMFAASFLVEDEETEEEETLVVWKFDSGKWAGLICGTGLNTGLKLTGSPNMKAMTENNQTVHLI